MPLSLDFFCFKYGGAKSKSFLFLPDELIAFLVFGPSMSITETYFLPSFPSFKKFFLVQEHSLLFVVGLQALLLESFAE